MVSTQVVQRSQRSSERGLLSLSKLGVMCVRTVMENANLSIMDTSTAQSSSPSSPRLPELVKAKWKWIVGMLVLVALVITAVLIVGGGGGDGSGESLVSKGVDESDKTTYDVKDLPVPDKIPLADTEGAMMESEDGKFRRHVFSFLSGADNVQNVVIQGKARVWLALVGGGGAGASSSGYHASAAGGGGQVVRHAVDVNVGDRFEIEVGEGAVANGGDDNRQGGHGKHSRVTLYRDSGGEPVMYIASGGRGGRNISGASQHNTVLAGSSGGGLLDQTASVGDASESNPGGKSTLNDEGGNCNRCGGGGGGAGKAGEDASNQGSAFVGGKGGDGTLVFEGQPLSEMWGGGGGGGSRCFDGAAGGLGGGGSGGKGFANGQDGQDGTGGGGGGSGHRQAGVGTIEAGALVDVKGGKGGHGAVAFLYTKQ